MTAFWEDLGTQMISELDRFPPPESTLGYCTQLSQGHTPLEEGLWFVFVPPEPAQPWESERRPIQDW